MNVTFIVNPELLAQHFYKAEPLLQPVIDQAARGEFTMEDIRRMTGAGKVVTAIAEKDDVPVMAMAFEFVHYPQKTVVNIMALGGQGVDEVVGEFWETFKAWCKGAGAAAIEASCSDAMARMLARYDFKSVYRVVRAEL